MRFPETFEGWGAFGSFDAVSEGPWALRERRIFRGIYIATLFLDLKGREHGRSRLIRLLERLYRPIALWRIRHLRFELFPERHVVRALMARHGG